MNTGKANSALNDLQIIAEFERLSKAGKHKEASAVLAKGSPELLNKVADLALARAKKRKK